MTLYEIDSAIMACVDSDTGEVIDEDKLSAMLMERNAKLEGVALWIKNLKANIIALKAEEEALHDRRKKAENKVESLTNWLKNALECQPFETARVRITFRKSTATDVDSEKIAKKWCVKKVTFTPDKTAIKEAILAGKKIRGAKIVINQNIQIK